MAQLYIDLNDFDNQTFTSRWPDNPQFKFGFSEFVAAEKSIKFTGFKRKDMNIHISNLEYKV